MNRPLLALGLSLLAASRAGAYESALIDGVPHVRQKPDFCGEACAEMALRRLGLPVDQDAVFHAAHVDPALGRGAVTGELADGLRRLGFEVGQVFRSFDAKSEASVVEAEWRALHRDLVERIPSIVCMHYDDSPAATEHFRLILGYDERTDEVIFHEPAEANGAYRRMKRPLFLRLWSFRPRAGVRTLIRLRLELRQFAAPAPERKPTDADLAQHVMQLQQKLPWKGFTVALSKPFVVVGDEAPETVRKRARETVHWTAERLKRDFFEADPEEIIDVWVLKDRASYLKAAWKIFGDRPATPYGYYLANQKAMVMNIGPGAGTLVHELVHPYVRANFPASPAWFNEGLASLYERPADKDGHLWGLPNWRLPGLQAALQRNEVPSLRSLMALDEASFYDDDTGVHYAQARYLLYYLQEKGLLPQYVREFRAGHASDPSGFATLQKTLGESDMPGFERRWRRFVAALQFR